MKNLTSIFVCMNLFNRSIQVINQQIYLPILEEKQVELWVKREDQIHEFVSGNKFRKLKYNIQEAKHQKKETILTFGGAYSNHIVATAVACNISGLRSIGVIRGEELKNNLEKYLQENQTLRKAHENGMKFEFVTREHFRRKNDESFINQLKEKFGDFYLVPEGGTNALAIQGCEEILTEEDEKFNYICCAVGTGGTIAGLINSRKKHQEVIGFSSLKGGFLTSEIEKLTSKRDYWHIQNEYHFGGYAKYNESLINFINEFKEQTHIQLDPIYTAKMMFGILDLVKQDKFLPKTKILAIHTGGLQGIKGVNQQLKKKNLAVINV